MTCGFVDNSSPRRVIQARPAISGSYFTPSSTGFSANVSAVAAINTAYLWPFNVALYTTGLSAEVTVLAAGNLRMALYDCDDMGLPLNLIEESAAISTGAIGVKDFAFTATRRISAPMWGAINFDALPTMRVGLGATQVAAWQVGNTATGSSPLSGAFSTPLAFGAFPAVLTGSVYSAALFTTTPIVFYKGA